MNIELFVTLLVSPFLFLIAYLVISALYRILEFIVIGLIDFCFCDKHTEPCTIVEKNYQEALYIPSYGMGSYYIPEAYVLTLKFLTGEGNLAVKKECFYTSRVGQRCMAVYVQNRISKKIHPKWLLDRDR